MPDTDSEFVSMYIGIIIKADTEGPIRRTSFLVFLPFLRKYIYQDIYMYIYTHTQIHQLLNGSYQGCAVPRYKQTISNLEVKSRGSNRSKKKIYLKEDRRRKKNAVTLVFSVHVYRPSKAWVAWQWDKLPDYSRQWASNNTLLGFHTRRALQNQAETGIATYHIKLPHK